MIAMVECYIAFNDRSCRYFIQHALLLGIKNY